MLNFRNKWTAVWVVLTLLWMVLIFCKSSESYTQQDLQPQLSTWLQLDTVERLLPQLEFHYGGGRVSWTKPYHFIDFFIRKTAHVTEYAVLAFLLIKLSLALRLPRARALLLGALFALLYAMLDEWYQSFVPGRTGHAIDVAVDSLGIVLVVISFVIAGVIGRWKKREQTYLQD